MILPADFIDNRVILRPMTEDGITMTLLADTGGGFFITPAAAARAGLVVSEVMIEGNRGQMTEMPRFQDQASIPPVLIQGEIVKCSVFDVDRNFMADLDGMVGTAWFADRVWTFDYLSNKLIYHDKLHSDVVNNTEHSVPLAFQQDAQGNRSKHFPRIQAVIDDEVIDFLFDTGATLCLSDTGLAELNHDGGRYRGTSFITETVFRKWMTRHPEWRVIHHAERATGHPIIEVPGITIAGYTVGPVWFTFRQDPNFHQFISDLMDTRVEGALGGSALQYFRITADYPNGVAYFERSHNGS